MNPKDILVNQIINSGTDRLSFDMIQFYSGKNLVSHKAGKFTWNRDKLASLSFTELKMIAHG
jgi:hypothetical protein